MGMKRWMAIAAVVLTTAGCGDLVGLGQVLAESAGPSKRFDLRLMGSADGKPDVKLLVLPGVASDPTSDANAYAVTSLIGPYEVTLYSNRNRYYTVFAFTDANDNGRYDKGEPSSFGATGNNTYLQFAWIGEEWTVTEVSAFGSRKLTLPTQLSLFFNG